MRIIQLTDCHIYGDAASNFDGINTKKTFERVLEGVQKVKNPDLVVGTGDLSMDGSPQSYSWLRQRLERIDAPVILIPGNHDQQDELENRIGSKCFLKCSNILDSYV